MDPGDIRSHVERMATAYNLSAEELSSFIVSDQDRLYKLSYDIMTEKTLDKILDFVNVRELEKEEYEKALDLLEKMKAASAEQEETEESEQDWAMKQEEVMRMLVLIVIEQTAEASGLMTYTADY